MVTETASNALSTQEYCEAAPKVERYMVLDSYIITLVDHLLTAPIQELDVAIAAVRYMISERDDTPCSDEVLKGVIDDASWFLSAPDAYKLHGKAKFAQPKTYHNAA